MPHPLIDRLTKDLGWPRLSTMGEVAEFTRREGVHVLFVTGDAERNLETPDVAVILPELRMAFQGRFDCAVADDAVEEAVRAETKVFKTPSLIFYREGEMIGAIPKVRDWDDYMARTERFLSLPQPAE